MWIGRIKNDELQEPMPRDVRAASCAQLKVATPLSSSCVFHAVS